MRRSIPATDPLRRHIEALLLTSMTYPQIIQETNKGNKFTAGTMRVYINLVLQMNGANSRIEFMAAEIYKLKKARVLSVPVKPITTAQL